MFISSYDFSQDLTALDKHDNRPHQCNNVHLPSIHRRKTPKQYTLFVNRTWHSFRKENLPHMSPRIVGRTFMPPCKIHDEDLLLVTEQ